MASDGRLQPQGAEVTSAYVELLRESRGLRDELHEARDAWYAKLAAEQKEETLFELEILLKGLACFANPRNHPGAGKRQTIVGHDFRTQLEHACDGMSRSVQLARMMLGERDRAIVFHRYLETVLPEDNARTKLVYAAMTPESPEESLFVLRQSLTNLIEVGAALSKSSRTTYRVFFAHLSTTVREIAGSAFFNPLSALEFRPEFDKIHSSAVLDLIHQVEGEHAHRLVALTFLSLFRMLRYVRLLESITIDHSDKRVWGRSYLVLAVLRSDARALSNYLWRRSGELLAKDFETCIERVGVREIDPAANELQERGRRLTEVKNALLSVAAMLRLELRRVFEHDVPAAHDKLSAADMRLRLQTATEALRPMLQLAVFFLGRALDPSFDETNVFDVPGALHDTRVRLRAGAWMFAQIARAFTSKARHADPLADTWSAPERYGFVGDFLAYYRAMGHPILVLGGYERTRDLLAALAALQDTDLIDPTRLDAAARECEALYAFSMQLYVGLSQRELSGVPFDRQAAARLLKRYLGD
ncbi:MAG TPA: hypothetical protein PK156_35105 [Polyangium sp.]|nr:hypothetical protein [Polyangium sp.]